MPEKRSFFQKIIPVVCIGLTGVYPMQTTGIIFNIFLDSCGKGVILQPEF